MDVPLEQYQQWPPFYTLQPNLDTRAQQLRLWSEILLNFAKHSKLFIASPEDFAPVTRNSSVNRALNEEFLHELFHYMKTSKKVLSANGSFFVLWKSVEGWGELVHAWAADAGRVGSVETLEGLVSGDETVGQEFYNMPVSFLHTILKKSKKVELFEVGGAIAVKFFN